MYSHLKSVTVADIRFTPELSERAILIAMRLFRLRQARDMHVEVNPAWETLTELYYQRALRGERGTGEQEQCIIQGIKIAIWESGQIPTTWTSAFPLPYTPPKPQSLPARWRQRVMDWYRQIRDAYRRLRTRLNDNV